MKTLILIIAVFQGIPEQINKAEDYSYQANYDSALAILNPFLESYSGKDSLYFRAIYLKAWNIKQKGDRESLKQVELLINDHIQIPEETYPLLASRMYALLGTTKYALNDLYGLQEYSLKSLLISEKINDTLGVTLALRNIFSFQYRVISSKEESEKLIQLLEKYAAKGDEEQVRYLTSKAYYEFRFGKKERGLALIARARDIAKTLPLKHYEDVLFSQAEFLVYNENLDAVEPILFELLNDERVQKSVNSTYKALARLVQFYVYSRNQEMAETAFFELKRNEKNLDIEALKIGVYAEMAYKGIDNPADMDPVFQGLKKSSLFGLYVTFIPENKGVNQVLIAFLVLLSIFATKLFFFPNWGTIQKKLYK